MTSPCSELVDGHSVSEIRWRAVMMDKHGNYVLHQRALSSSNTSPDVVRILIEYYKDTQWRKSWFMRAVPFKRPVAYTVTLSPVPIEEISDTQCVVRLATDPRHFHIITSAAGDAENLSSSVDFVAFYSRFAVIQETSGNICSRDALFIRLELNKLALLVFVTVSIITAIGCGVVVGLWQRSLDAGFGVSGVILGVVGIVEGFLTWLLN